jgi:hypothetical protein
MDKLFLTPVYVNKMCKGLPSDFIGNKCQHLFLHWTLYIKLEQAFFNFKKEGKKVVSSFTKCMRKHGCKIH